MFAAVANTTQISTNVKMKESSPAKNDSQPAGSGI